MRIKTECGLVSLFFLFFSFGSPFARAGGVSVHISDRLRQQKLGCVDYLYSPSIRPPELAGHAQVDLFFGRYEELESLLVKASVERSQANKIVRVLDDVHASAFQYPTLAFAAAMLDELIRERQLIVCVTVGDCERAKGRNYLRFTSDDEAIFMLPPPAPGAPLEFAINFFATAAPLAAQKILVGWMHSNYRDVARSGSTADRLYLKYAGGFNGELPPAPGSFNRGFALTFMALYQATLSNELYSLMRPEHALENRLHLVRTTLRDLMTGPNRSHTSDVVIALGINKTNFFNRLSDILIAMLRRLEEGE